MSWFTPTLVAEPSASQYFVTGTHPPEPDPDPIGPHPDPMLGSSRKKG
jgi:hypothetical protein